MTLGESLYAQHPLLREVHPATRSACGQRIEEADQIECRSRLLERCGQGEC